MNIPNWVTVSRLFAIPLLFITLHTPSDTYRWISLVLFLVISGTDWLDGYLARRLDQVTELGKFLDPLVDKLLVLAPLLVLVEQQQIPAWGVFLILARELIIAGWRVNQTQVSGANIWGKAKTVSQIVAIALLIAPLPITWEQFAIAAFWISVALTILSGVMYLLPKQQSPHQN